MGCSCWSAGRSPTASSRTDRPSTMPYARRLYPLTLITIAVAVVWIVVAVAVAPTDATEGVRQRLTYLHPAFAIVTLVAFVAAAVFGWQHLKHDRPRDDLRAYVAIHLGQIFCLI